MVKKEKELNPELIDATQLSEEHLEGLKEIGKAIKNNIISVENQEEQTYFKQVLDKLFSPDDIELKTEYLNPIENFAGAKLSFLGVFGGIPLSDEFINVFERKRVSLERKSRQELVIGLGHRQIEEQERMQQQRSLFGGGSSV